MESLIKNFGCFFPVRYCLQYFQKQLIATTIISGVIVSPIKNFRGVLWILGVIFKTYVYISNFTHNIRKILGTMKGKI